MPRHDWEIIHWWRVVGFGDGMAEPTLDFSLLETNACKICLVLYLHGQRQKGVKGRVLWFQVVSFLVCLCNCELINMLPHKLLLLFGCCSLPHSIINLLLIMLVQWAGWIYRNQMNVLLFTGISSCLSLSFALWMKFQSKIQLNGAADKRNVTECLDWAKNTPQLSLSLLFLLTSGAARYAQTYTTSQ